MRKTITFKIEGYDKPYTVNELSIREIISLIQNDVVQGQDIESLKQVFTDVLLPMCTNVSLDELMDMAPSEIKQLWDKFQEMNSVFFDVAQKMGIAEIWEDLKKGVIADFSKLLALSSKPVTSAS